MTTQPVTVLLIEDDEVDAMGVRRAFKKAKIANPIHHVKNGLEALEVLRTPGRVPHPVTVLLDLNMPRMNGIEFLAEVRKDTELQSLVVFVLTTSNADKDKAAAYAKNVAGYIVKSSPGTGFLEAVSLLDHYWRVVELPTI